MLAGGRSLLLWHAGVEAAAYRTRLEVGSFSYYEHTSLSFGLRVVPTVGPVGAVAAALLTLASISLLIVGRRQSAGD